MLRQTLGLVLATCLVACGGQSGKDQDLELSSEAETLLEDHARQVMRMRPVNATRLGLTDEDLDSRINDAMDDFSRDHMRNWRRKLRQMRVELGELSPADIDPLTRAAMDDIYSVYLGASDIPFGFIDMQGRHRPYIVNQIDQPMLEIPRVMTNFQRLESAEDVADYLRRMWALSSLVASVLNKFNADANAGWLPPRPILDAALEALQRFIAPRPDQHDLVTRLLSEIDSAGMLSDEEREKVRNEAVTLMVRVVYPSYLNAIKSVRSRLPEAGTAAGIWAQPLGAEFYAHSIRHEARTDLSAEEIHDLGLAEVKRILAQMDNLLNAQGYSEGSVGARMQRLAADPTFLFEDSEAGRQELLDRLNANAEVMQARLPEYFHRLPREGFEIKPVPVASQAGAAGGFYDGPPADGSGPGIFWINMRDMKDLPWFRMPTLLYHETVPGHHLQIALARSQRGRPLLWRFSTNSAYSEGWALYSERLAAEIGAYNDDPLADIGRLQAELFRAVRLVVDTGMHHKRWSRQEAIDYMRDTTGRGITDVTAEIQRYMAWPGQALSYKLGMQEMLSIRSEARSRLGEGFDLAAFHDAVLATGPVSMPLLREQVEKLGSLQDR